MAFCLTLLKNIPVDLQDHASNIDRVGFFFLIPSLEIISGSDLNSSKVTLLKRYQNKYLTLGLLMFI